jgi:hypothetical protein
MERFRRERPRRNGSGFCGLRLVCRAIVGPGVAVPLAYHRATSGPFPRAGWSRSAGGGRLLECRRFPDSQP